MARSIVIKYAVEISQAIFIGRLKGQDLIATRSWSDRDAIVARSLRDRGHDHARSWPPSSRNQCYNPSTRSDGDRLRTKITIDARSWPDHSEIMARSWRDRCSFEAKLRLIYRQSRSHDTTQGNCFHDPCNPLSRLHQ